MMTKAGMKRKRINVQSMRATWECIEDEGIADYDSTYLGEKEPKTAEYGYDNTSQLVSVDYNAFQSNELYGCDANGNRKSFETGKNNQLLSDGVFDYKYDAEGNRYVHI
jgi:hypothetical protein